MSQPGSKPNSLEYRVKMTLGEQMMTIHAMQVQIEELTERLIEADAKIKELSNAQVEK